MSFDAGAYRLLSYSTPVAPVASAAPAEPVAGNALEELRVEARALRKQAREAQLALKAQKAQQAQQANKPQPPAPPLFSLPGLANVLQNLFNWLAPAPQPPAGPKPPKPPKPPKDPGNNQPTPPSQPTQPGKATDFKLSSFNILGSTHTAGGKKPGYASGVVRVREAAELLKQKKVDVVGFQEMNNDQANAFKQEAGDTFGLFPGASKRHLGSHNSVAWRKDTWDLVSSEIVDFPSHLGRKQPSPVVLLQNKKTGQKAYFINVHNAPGYHKGGTQQKWRDQAVSQQVALINKLKQSGYPVIMTGDMNDKAIAFNRMHKEADMHAANEGPGHRMPKRMNIDWIFGSNDVEFSKFGRDASPVKQKISDHGMLVSNVHID